MQAVPHAPEAGAQDRRRLLQKQRGLDQPFDIQDKVFPDELRGVFPFVLVKPEIRAVSPQIIKSYRRRIEELDEAEPDTSKIHGINWMQVVPDDARLIYKACVPPDQSLIAVDHVAPIEHV